ncbi:MAG: hypothetical protein M0003_09360 [Acidithiobacillus sp.]|nr:hypothetical protein [Acidithiobacillus sp.]
MLRNVLPFEDRDTWIAAYAAWYQHFLAMQPVMDQIAKKWAQEMTESTLTNFHLRDDQQEIVQLALHGEGYKRNPLAGCKPSAGYEPGPSTDRLINSSDLVAVYNQHPTISQAVAMRLGELLQAGEPQTVAALTRIVAEELHGEPEHQRPAPALPFPAPQSPLEKLDRHGPGNHTETSPRPATAPAPENTSAQFSLF